MDEVENQMTLATTSLLAARFDMSMLFRIRNIKMLPIGSIEHIVNSLEYEQLQDCIGATSARQRK